MAELSILGKQESLVANKLKLIFDFVFRSYFNRLKLGEGGLLAFNIFYALYARHSYVLMVEEGLVSLLVLCSLYAYNDYADRYKDSNNSKKDAELRNRKKKRYKAKKLIHHR